MHAYRIRRAVRLVCERYFPRAASTRKIRGLNPWRATRGPLHKKARRELAEYLLMLRRGGCSLRREVHREYTLLAIDWGIED
jgi:hypothetical protein